MLLNNVRPDPPRSPSPNQQGTTNIPLPAPRHNLLPQYPRPALRHSMVVRASGLRSPGLCPTASHARLPDAALFLLELAAPVHRVDSAR